MTQSDSTGGGYLFPVWAMPGPVAAQVGQTATIQYPPDYLFDFERGEFVKDGAGRPVKCDGYTAWAQWITLANLTQRGRFMGVPNWFGVDFDGAMRKPGQGAYQAYIAREHADASRPHRGTGQCQNFQFRSEQGDESHYSFEVHPARGTAIRIDVTNGAQ